MTLRKLTPIQSIKKYCKEQCCAGDLISWKECNVDCVLKPYSLGKRPKKQAFSEYMKPSSSPKRYEEKQAVLPIKSSKNNELQEGLR